jgi:serpin B
MNRTISSRFITLALLAASLTGCGGQDSEQQATTVAKSNAQRVDTPQVSVADNAVFAADNEAFALAAYQKMAAGDGNIVYSPASISIALAMAYAGAAGTTASEMAAAMHYTLPPERLHLAFDALDLALGLRGKGKQGADGGPMRLHVVNAAWAERTYSFKSDYLDVLATNYGAGINLLDFITGSASARLTINDWVAVQTENKILNLLPEGTLNSSTRLVLTNAVYFNAAWKEAFDPQRTGDAKFTLLDGSQVTSKFMSADLSSAPAVKGAGFVAVDLPYQDDQLSLLVVVPDSGTFAAFESSLDATKLDSIVGGLAPQAVMLGLPRFKIETSQGLADLLKSLGMTSAFTYGPADFSGMDGTRNLYISNVIHKAFIDVAEKGTEAAAATAVTMNAGAAPPQGLRISVDRPFLYFLRDQPTGAILFMGRVLDSTKN